MATAQKINARDITIEVAKSGDSADWVEVDGINSVKPNPSDNEENVDTTTFSSEGMYEEQIMQRGATMELEGFELKDEQGKRSEGQQLCEDLAEEVGTKSQGKVRFRYVMDDEWTIWTATFSMGERGGGNNDKSAWKCTLTRCGKSTTEPVDTSS